MKRIQLIGATLLFICVSAYSQSPTPTPKETPAAQGYIKGKASNDGQDKVLKDLDKQDKADRPQKEPVDKPRKDPTDKPGKEPADKPNREPAERGRKN